VSRTLSAALALHLSGKSHTRAFMLLLDLRDGTSIGITDHDKDIEFDIGDGAVTYGARTGILASDIVLSAGLDPDNCEITGPIGETVTLEAVLGGRFDRAVARLFQVNWKNLGAGAIKLLQGNVTETRIEGGKFVFEIRSDVDRFNQTVGRTIVNNCDADHGDARCGRVPESVTGTVISVTDAMTFRVAFIGVFANEYFNAGTVEAMTGELAGTLPVEVFSWTSAGNIVLFTPLAEAPAIGDTFNIVRGCGKSRADCMARNNIVNFRGFPEIPGSDAINRATIPGQGNDD
jgi:uncharacterized phage protein (TIGR02218 family)